MNILTLGMDMLKTVILTATIAGFILAWVLTWMNRHKTEEETFSKNPVWRCIQEVWYPAFWIFLVHVPSVCASLGIGVFLIFLFAMAYGELGIFIGCFVGVFAAFVVMNFFNKVMGGGEW